MKKQVQKKAVQEKETREVAKRVSHSLDNGWDSPPAQLPRFGEIAMGIVYDPQRNTR